MEKKVWRIIDILNWTTEYFGKKNIESPRLNIELMLCDVLNINRLEIYTNFEKPLDKNELLILRNMILRRAEHIPLQYILGKTNFCGLEILVNDAVMIPRPETELLVELVLNSIDDKKATLSILDIGTGSGCIALALAKSLPYGNIWAIDKSHFALMTAKNNASNLAVRSIEFSRCDVLNEIPTNKKFDIIVSNPPYIPIDEYNKLEPEVLNSEPQMALTDETDGLTFYKRYVEILDKLLKLSGKFFFEFGFGQSDEIRNIFNQPAINYKIHNDLAGIPRIISGTFIRSI